jgi:hypothetical protein
MVGQKQVFQRRRIALQPVPLVGCDQDGHFHTATADYLRPFAETIVQHFTKPRFGILNLPGRHDVLLMLYARLTRPKFFLALMTGQITGQE